MSVVLQHPPSSLSGAFYDDDDGSLIKNVDWGTVTPQNSIREVEIEIEIEIEIDQDFGSALAKRGTKRKSLQTTSEDHIPKHQNVLLLRELRQRFSVVEDYQVPETRSPDEAVVKIQAIGLNPIDWKSV